MKNGDSNGCFYCFENCTDRAVKNWFCWYGIALKSIEKFREILIRCMSYVLFDDLLVVDDLRAKNFITIRYRGARKSFKFNRTLPLQRPLLEFKARVVTDPHGK